MQTGPNTVNSHRVFQPGKTPINSCVHLKGFIIEILAWTRLSLCQRCLECLRGAASDSWDVCEFTSGSELGREPHPGPSVPPRSASKSRNLQQVPAELRWVWTTQRLHCLPANTGVIQAPVRWETSHSPPSPPPTYLPPSLHLLSLGGAAPGRGRRNERGCDDTDVHTRVTKENYQKCSSSRSLVP